MKGLIQICIACAMALPSVCSAECYTLVNATNHQVDVKYVPQGITPGPGFVASQSFSPGSQQQYCTPYKVTASIATPNTIWEGNHGLVMGPGGSPQGTYRMVPASK
jgi:hypothetical protein